MYTHTRPLPPPPIPTSLPHTPSSKVYWNQHVISPSVCFLHMALFLIEYERTYSSWLIVIYLPPLLLCRWHRLGLSVKGNTLTVIHDCQQTDEPIRMGRTMPPVSFEKKGVIFVGYQVFEEDLYTVSMNKIWASRQCCRQHSQCYN